MDFPIVVGAIDCTHVQIIAPKADDPVYPEQIFVNRHGTHSINVQMVCDANLKILNCNSKFPGATHDAYIWRNSSLKVKLRRMFSRDNPLWLLGDSGYPLEPWLMTPKSDPTTAPECRYNSSHAKTRNVIERCFGVLKGRFRCLLGYRVLH